MALPALVDLLNLIERDVEVLELWAFECCQLIKLVIAQIQVLQV